MKRSLFSTAALGAAALALSSTAIAGGQLDETKLIGPSAEFPGLIDALLVPIAWPANCSTVNYKVDDIPATTIDIPNGVLASIPPAVLAQEMQESFDQWNQIPTSYINFQIEEVVALNNGTRSFDFINELTWETPAGSGFLASSPSTSLIEDANLAPGDDIDGDGDSDVFDPATADPALADTCHDADGDGDIEFAAGFYPAGTILDNDVQYNDDTFGTGFYWETEPSSDVPFGFVGSDIQAVAVHEFGHSHGLSHSLINQISDTDGTGSTMFPFIDIGDEASEVGQRDLHDDDISWSSFVYQEGTASSGNPALQSGDVAFASAYDVLQGSVQTGDGENILGGNVFAVDNSTGRVVGEAFSGTALIALTPDLNFFEVVDPATNALNGNYSLPVLKGAHRLFLQASDGDPAGSSRVSFTGFIGEVVFGQQTFGEEGFKYIGAEREFETDPSATVVVASAAGPSLDFITNTELTFRNTGPLFFIGTSAAIGFNDVIYAERFNNDETLSAINAGATVTTALYRTWVSDASVVPAFKSAGIYFGTVDEDGNAVVDLDNPVVEEAEFVAQQDDLSPLYINGAQGATNKIRNKLQENPDTDVFVVLEAKNDFATGPSGFPPLLGLDNDGIVSGTSYLSRAGGPFIQRSTGTDWAVELRMTQD